MNKKKFNIIVAIATIILGGMTLASLINKESVLYIYTMMPFACGAAYLAYLWEKSIVRWCEERGIKDERELID